MFDKATRMKIRFDTTRGLCSVEDLWDLPLTSTVNAPNLDHIALALDRKIKQEGEVVSFVDKTKKGASETLRLMFDVVMHVITVKQAENKARLELASKKEQRQEIMAAIDSAKKTKLTTLPIEELEKMLAKMNEEEPA